jgi:hypothetical protein
MLKFFTILFLISINRLAAQSFSPNEIRADLLILKDKIEKIHPNPYKFISENHFRQVFDSLNRAEKVLTTKQTFAHFLNLSKAIHCGHSYILADERIIPPNNSNPKFLPLDLVIFENRAYISKNLSDNITLSKGTEIIEIEGIPSKRLIQNLSKYTFQNADGINEEADRYYIQRNLRKLLHIYLGEQDQILLKIKREDKIEAINLKTKTINQIRDTEDERYPILNADLYNNLILKKLDESSSLLKIRSFEANEGSRGDFQQDILNIFREIKQNQSKNLIVDLRNNAGGRMDYADEILKYLLNKPYQHYQISSKSVIKEVKKGMTTRRFYEPPKAPQSYFFEGNLFVLINEGTFSAAVYMAAHLHEAQVGKFIGTTCGGAADGSSAGEFMTFRLPNTNFTVSLPIQKIDYNTSSKLQLNPDYEVKQSLSDFMKNEDSVLNFVEELLKKL